MLHARALLALTILSVASAACAKGKPVGAGGGGSGSATSGATTASGPASSTSTHGAATTSGVTTGTSGATTSSGATGSSSSGMSCGAAMPCGAATDCPAPGSDCVAATCVAGCCAKANKGQGSLCTSAGGKVCNGSGQCVACLSPSDCPATGTTCSKPTCAANHCSTQPAPLGAPCSDSGGVVCTGMGTCTSMHCSDGVKDADETAIDCGGATCQACANGSTCVANKDCTSGDCHTGTCYSCGSHGAQDLCCPNGSGNIEVTQLSFGQSITSCDGRFTLAMQSDGNLVLYFNGTALWATSTVGCGDHAVMQTDGNFVVYSASSSPCWSSNTANNPGAFITLQNDGNLVIYNGGAIWASNTGGH